MRQGELIVRACAVLSRDERVLGIWAAGSHARGSADDFSDVDLWVVVAPADLDSFCQNWPELSDAIAVVVLREQVPGVPVFTHVTDEWLRYDVSIGTPDQIPGRTTSTVKALYDPADLSAGLATTGPPLQPDPVRVQRLTQEFLRLLGLLPVVLGRNELVLGVSGGGLVRNLLVQLMLEDVAVEDRGGALRLNPLLPAARLRTLAELPPIQATRDSVVDIHLACAAAFLPLARELYIRGGMAWPQSLEDAARRRLTSTLAVNLPAS